MVYTGALKYGQRNNEIHGKGAGKGWRLYGRLCRCVNAASVSVTAPLPSPSSPSVSITDAPVTCLSVTLIRIFLNLSRDLVFTEPRGVAEVCYAKAKDKRLTVMSYHFFQKKKKKDIFLEEKKQLRRDGVCANERR